MTPIADEGSSGNKFSNAVLWTALVFVLLLAAVVLEILCLGALYLYDSRKANFDAGVFAREHILTRPFASAPASPVPGKQFLGHLRSVNPRGWAQFLVLDELLGWRLGADISTYYGYDEHTGEDLIVTDANGFSVDVDQAAVPLQKSSDAYRIIVLGGSTVMGEGSGVPSQNIVGMLQAGVRERGLTGPGGKRIELINGGVDGYNSAQEYLYLVSSLLGFKPDLVIVYDGWNDIDIRGFSTSPFRTGTHREIARRARQSYSIAGSMVFVAENLATALTQGEFRFGILELPLRLLHKLSPNDNHASTSLSFDPRSIEYYRDNHRALLALADERLSVAAFLQPLAGTARALSDDEKASWWFRQLREDALSARITFYQDARSVLQALKSKRRGNDQVCIADLSKSFDDVSERVYADSGHLLPRGNQIVAARMLDELVACRFLSK